jgi:hypothetical protein
MASFFSEILKRFGLEVVDLNRSIWQYNLSGEDLVNLKAHINKTFKDYSFDLEKYPYPIDITMYFAEYWRQKYDGSKNPSIKTIVESLQIEESKHKTVYEIAKKGAERLGLKWINIGVNDLKFRTLLSQGGIPLNFLKKDNNSFSTFIRRIIQSEISSVEELKNYPEITNLLPASFRNDFIYDSSFKIIEEVLNENINLLGDTEESLKSLIKVIKQEGTKKAQKKANETIKLSWLLKGEGNLDLFCLIDLPNKIKLEDNSNKVLHLNCGDSFIAKYKRNQHGDYLLAGNKLKEIRVQDDQDTQIYLDGNENSLAVRNESRPHFDQPTLWIKEDNILQYVNSNSTKNEDAEIIFPENWKINSSNEIDEQIEIIELNSSTYKKISFSDIIEFNEIGQASKIKFQTNTNVDYSISYVTLQPQWFCFSQYRVFNKVPEIQVYDGENKGMRSGFEISYRYAGDTEYVKLISVIKLGLYEIKVTIGGETEIHDYFYLINSFNIDSTIINENKGQYVISNKDKFNLKFISNEIIKIETKDDVVAVENINIKLRPKFIKVSIKNNQQSKGCNLYLNLPFSGVYLADNFSKISDVKTPLLLNNTKGYRLYIPNDISKKYFARISNINYPGIKTDVRLDYGSNDLLKIQEDVSKLILLSNISSGIPKVKMEVIEEIVRFPDRTRRLSTYYFKSYNATFSKIKDENTITSFVKLFAIPFNVNEELILPYELLFDENESSYSIVNLPQEVKEFCLVTDNSTYFTLPKYINYIAIEDFKIYLNKEVVDIDEFRREKPYAPLLADRIERIENISVKLSESPLFVEGSEWSILNKYIDLCMEFKLPFNTFDHINAIASDFNLYAKFIFNILNSEKSIGELIHVIQKIEDNIGVSLLWVPIKTWIDLFSDEEILVNRFMELMLSFYSSNKFANEIVNFIFTKSPDLLDKKDVIKINDNFYELRNEIARLREELGNNINDLPKTYPVIQRYFRNAMPIEKNEHKGLITIKLAPLAVALSLSGSSTRIWKESEENSGENTEFIKRIILYISNLNPNWYYSTIYHYIKK